MEDAIASDIAQKIRSLNEPELSLEIWHLDTRVLSFPVAQESGSTDKSALAARLKFLIQTLGDRKRDVFAKNCFVADSVEPQFLPQRPSVRAFESSSN